MQSITSRVKLLQKKAQKLSKDKKTDDLEVLKSLAFDLPASKKDGSCQEDLKGKHTECVFKR